MLSKTTKMSSHHLAWLSVLSIVVWWLCLTANASAQVNAYSFGVGTAVPLQSSAGGTVLGSGTATDDQVYAAQPIGFSFPFNGQTYTTVNVSANGWLSFGTPITSAQKFFFPIGASGGSGVIAAFAADLRGSATGQLSTRTIGTAPNRTFVVQYANWTLFSPTSTTMPFSFSFEILLQENGIIRTNFGAATNAAQFPTTQVQVGLRGASTSDFVIKSAVFTGTNLTSPSTVFLLNAAYVQQLQSLQGTATPPPTTAAPTTFSISGTVRNSIGQGLSGVVISAGGRQTTSQNGAFTLTGLANGTYTIAPSSSLWTFPIATSSATVNGANVSNVVLTAAAPSISGTARLNNQGLAGVTMTLTSSVLGSPFTIGTGTGGFAVGGLPNGTYTLTPTLNGYSFTPASRTITIAGGISQAMQDFTATQLNPPTFTITGTILSSQGVPVPNVTVMLSNGQNAVTSVAGTYSFTGIPNGSYTLVAASSIYIFQNNRAVLTVNGANLTQNFTVLTSVISGNVTVGGVARSGVTVLFAPQPSGLSLSVVSGANGQYSRAVPSGTYIVTAVATTNATFSPSFVTVTIGSGATVSNVNFTGTAVPVIPSTFIVSGLVRTASGAGVGNVTITLNTNPLRTAVTNNAGQYSFTGVPAGTYTATASASGVGFAAATQNVTVTNIAVGNVNFTAQLGTITGRITTAAGTGLQGVTLTAGSSSATTNAQGNYTFTNLLGQTYTITPTLAGFTFTPQTRTVALPAGGTVAGQDFTAQAAATPQFTLGGRVTSSANPTSGVAGVTVTRGMNTVMTDASGFYTFTNVPNGTYTITVSNPNLTFAQSSQSATVNNANLSNVNFSALLANVSGSVTVNNVGQAGITVSDGVRSAVTDASGAYTIRNVPAGTYTLTPSGGTNLTFTPATRSVTVAAGASQTGQNFTGAMPMTPQPAFAAPTPINPANNADIQVFSCASPCFGFFWTLVPGAVSYRLQIASNAAFTQFNGGQIVQFNGITNISTFFGTTNFTLTANGTEYYWRVQAIDANGTASAYSAGTRFIVRTPQNESTLGTQPANITSQFDARVHGLNFSNSASKVWIPAYYDLANYTIAPYTNYAAASAEWATKAQRAKPNIFPLWDDYALTMARIIPVYVNNNGNQTPTVNAVTSWDPTLWQGSCYGFAISSIFHFAGIYNAQSPLFGVPVGNNARKLIHAHQSYQGFRLGSGGNTPNRTVQRLRDAIATGDRLQHPTISFRQPGVGGHAVVATSIRSRLDASGNAIADTVFVYDVNHPGSYAPFFYVDRATNSWRYDMAALNANAGQSVWSGTGTNFYIATDARTERTISFAGRPIVRTHADDVPPPQDVATVRFNAPTADQVQPTVEIRTTNGGSVLNNGKDPFGEDIQIPGAEPIFPLTGNLDEAPMPGIQGYTIPNAGLTSLSTRYTPVEAGTPTEISLNDGNRFTILGEWTASGGRAQTLFSDFENTAARFSTESAVPNWKMVLATLAPDRESWENVVRISGASFGANDSLGIRLVNDGSQVVVENFNTAKTFTMGFSRGTGQTFENLRIGAGETQTFLVTNWDDLNRSGFIQLIDRDSDGKIDVENTLRTPTDVRTPNAAQNLLAVSAFPNPASSQMTVEFALPTADNVRIEIVNLMGSVVASLTNAPKAAGKHRINADVSGLANGTYFVRIHTSTVSSSQPFQVVR